MTDNLKIKAPEDPTKINLNQSWEVSYWTTKFGITEVKLRQAVKAVGVLVVDVKRWLNNN